MATHRINIIGASGTGKTTLGKAVAEALQIPMFDSDDYFHVPTDPPYQTQRSVEERTVLLANDLQKQESWIVTGWVGHWLPHPAFDFSLCVFLYLPQEVRLERLRRRERARFGSRLDPGGDMEQTHLEFMEWTRGYDDVPETSTTLAKHGAYLQTLRCPVLRFEKEMPTAEQAQIILNKIK